MQGLYTGLALWNLLLLTVAALLGVFAGQGGAVDPQVHRLVGFFATLFGLLVQSILVTHFIGTMKWIQQVGPTAGVDDTKRARTAWIRGRMFPTVMSAMLVTVASAILGGSARGSLGLAFHIGLAVAAFVLNVLALLWAREAIAENRARMQGFERLALDRQARGLVPEAEVEALRPESGRAGGKVLLFLAANVWVLWLYRRHVLRLRFEPWWPYALACALLALLGWSLLRRWQARDPA